MCYQFSRVPHRCNTFLHPINSACISRDNHRKKHFRTSIYTTFVNQFAVLNQVIYLLTCPKYAQNIVAFFVLLQHFLLLAKNVTVGHSCLYDWQCTGTQYASVCDHYRCECQPGYILIDNNCYPGKESVYTALESLVYTCELLRFYFGRYLLRYYLNF